MTDQAINPSTARTNAHEAIEHVLRGHLPTTSEQYRLLVECQFHEPTLDWVRVLLLERGVTEEGLIKEFQYSCTGGQRPSHSALVENLRESQARQRTIRFVPVPAVS